MGSASEFLTAVVAISLASLAVAALLARFVMSRDAGTPQMRKISDAIRQGAEAFMRRQNMTIIPLALVVAVLIYVAYTYTSGSAAAFRATLSFILGAIC